MVIQTFYNFAARVKDYSLISTVHIRNHEYFIIEAIVEAPCKE